MSRVFPTGNTAHRSGTGGSPPSRARLRASSTLTVMAGDVPPPSQARVRGAALGLPAEGPGSLAAFGSRVVAFVVDAVGAALITGLFTAPQLPRNWSLLTFGVLTVVSLVLLGQTPGMKLLGLRLAHPREGARLAVWRAVVRTALLMLLIPALVVDADGRGLHDRWSDTAVVRE